MTRFWSHLWKLMYLTSLFYCKCNISIYIWMFQTEFHISFFIFSLFFWYILLIYSISSINWNNNDNDNSCEIFVDINIFYNIILLNLSYMNFSWRKLYIYLIIYNEMSFFLKLWISWLWYILLKISIIFIKIVV